MNALYGLGQSLLLAFDPSGRTISRSGASNSVSIRALRDPTIRGWRRHSGACASANPVGMAAGFDKNAAGGLPRCPPWASASSKSAR